MKKNYKQRLTDRAKNSDPVGMYLSSITNSSHVLKYCDHYNFQNIQLKSSKLKISILLAERIRTRQPVNQI